MGFFNDDPIHGCFDMTCYQLCETGHLVPRAHPSLPVEMCGHHTEICYVPKMLSFAQLTHSKWWKTGWTEARAPCQHSGGCMKRGDVSKYKEHTPVVHWIYCIGYTEKTRIKITVLSVETHPVVHYFPRSLGRVCQEHGASWQVCVQSWGAWQKTPPEHLARWTWATCVWCNGSRQSTRT